VIPWSRSWDVLVHVERRQARKRRSPTRRASLRGRPPAAITKERITIRLSRDVVEQFRATGDGWQTRMDAALKGWLKTHSPA
jgi:uncharacterized protein (DUF4415 family)